MKELRVQYQGEPWRILFAFDTERAAILLLGGNKAGDKRGTTKISRSRTSAHKRHLQSLKQKKEK